jgi:DNA-binding transcriptional LysR family regulator
MDWDSLRYVLAVGTAGTLAGAARLLGVNHTTVLRRIAAFEGEAGVRLFERLPGGYVPTEAGEALIAAARHIEETVVGLERRLAGRDLSLSGALRVTTTDTLMASLLPDMLAAFRSTHPGICVEVAVSNQMLNLTRRDADVAIRPSDDPPQTLVGRRLAAIAFSIYASPAYLERAPAPRQSWHDHSWLVPDDSLAATAVAKWIRSELAGVTVAASADSLLALRELAVAGLGLVVLPRYLGDPSTGLVRVSRTNIPAASALWVLTHEDLRRTARVRAFTEFMAQAIARRRRLLEGR